jgi:hypothetical protein
MYKSTPPYALREDCLIKHSYNLKYFLPIIGNSGGEITWKIETSKAEEVEVLY